MVEYLISLIMQSSIPLSRIENDLNINMTSLMAYPEQITLKEYEDIYCYLSGNTMNKTNNLIFIKDIVLN